MACPKILLHEERVGVSGGDTSHFQWMPCVGEIELETKPPTTEQLFSRAKEKGNSSVVE